MHLGREPGGKSAGGAADCVVEPKFELGGMDWGADVFVAWPENTNKLGLVAWLKMRKTSLFDCIDS